MKGIASTVAVLAALAMVPAAEAATTIAAVNTSTSADGSFTMTFSDAGMPAGEGGLFTSVLNFTTVAGIIGISVGTVTIKAGDANDTDLVSIQLSSAGLGTLDLFPAPYSTDADETFQLFPFPLDPGTYTLTVQGYPAIQNSGFFGQIDFTSNGTPLESAVPEPGTWVLLMTGLGLVGFALRRRSAATTGGTRVRGMLGAG